MLGGSEHFCSVSTTLQQATNFVISFPVITNLDTVTLGASVIRNVGKERYKRDSTILTKA